MDPILIYAAGGAIIGWLAWGAAFDSPVRACPRCGKDVVKGTLDCPHCQFDFRSIGSAERDLDG